MPALHDSVDIYSHRPIIQKSEQIAYTIPKIKTSINLGVEDTVLKGGEIGVKWSPLAGLQGNGIPPMGSDTDTEHLDLLKT